MKKRKYHRGLTFEEVGFIKAASKNGYARDYIMSFLVYPGRKLSPACVSEIVNSDRAPSVPPLSQKEFERFVASRLLHNQSDTELDDRGPLSTYLIHQELGWALSETRHLFADESRRLEFKRDLPRADITLSRCLVAAAAMANAVGGYIIFGIDDHKELRGITDRDWDDFDWDKFSSELARLFQPVIEWRKRTIEFHEAMLGVIHIEMMELPPVISNADWHSIKAGTVYYRYERSSRRIEPGDLRRLLERRDKIIRREVLSSK
ncbi:MAG: hypothetical protein GC153_01860 [Alphaproteobacteria bacterium]|nr:hypothetical protein [Alphaproteobacteria bacterium]